MHPIKERKAMVTEDSLKQIMPKLTDAIRATFLLPLQKAMNEYASAFLYVLYVSYVDEISDAVTALRYVVRASARRNSKTIPDVSVAAPAVRKKYPEEFLP